MERARLETGSLLKLRTGRGVWHAEGIGEDEIREGNAGGEMRGVLFWVNLARKDKGVEPTAQLLRAAGRPRPAGRRRDRPGRWSGRAHRSSSGLPGSSSTSSCRRAEPSAARSRPTSTASSTCSKARPTSAPTGVGRAARRSPSSDRVRALTVADAQPGTRFMLMAGKPYGETPVYNGPYVD